MTETDAAEMIDAFREQLHDKLARHFAESAEKHQAPEVQPDGFTPGIAISEETTVSGHHDTDSDDPHAAASLQPGDIPVSSAPPPEPPPVPARTESLPNGRVGQVYEVELDAVIDHLPSRLVLEDDAGTGLTLTETRWLQGKPTLSGSVVLSMVGVDSRDEPVERLTLKLALIPSSRDLWQNRASDPNAPYAKPDAVVERLAAGDGWRMAVGSLRGRSHAHRGGQRDDEGVIDRTTSGWNLLLVGDGAGSCEFSRQGSLLATTTARDTLLSTLDENAGAELERAVLTWWAEGDRSRMPQALVIPLQETIITAVHRGHRAIHDEAEASGRPLKAFSTTLLLALHKQTSQGHVVVTFGIGDGAIAALFEGCRATLMNSADSGQHAGQTRFLDAPLFQEGQSLYQRVKVGVFETLDALILATDGVTDPKFDSDNAMQEAAGWWSLYGELAPVLAAPRCEEERDPLLEYLDFFIERHHDDRTLAVLYRDGRVANADSGDATDE
ncbi:PP2C family serine/threonine-protein phosphatase [Modicisalibacter coralii]|uniref:PP2C family serine/threonine-protein phosphatase n=1 Tax=Modicisalibacter coralii TaxID=2304602 RepID=UPI001396782F|nr:PP2C family serine/threonine-protein phosphatase [Halomonas coralii]